MADNTRPKLTSFRVTHFQGQNPPEHSQSQRLSLELVQTIEVGVAVDTKTAKDFQAIVKIDLRARAKHEETQHYVAEFSAGYEGKYLYASGVTEEQISAVIEQEPYQYGLVSQSFPLAMTHFRRELQSFGIDARELPLGL